MSQGANQIVTAPPVPGPTLVSQANTALAALLTLYSGTSAPGSPSVAQSWLDTSGSPIFILKSWDGAQWVVEAVLDTTNHQWYAPIGGATATLASAATTNLGSTNASQITVTGAATITSFGAPSAPGATLAGVVKFIRFTGICTLANSASLVLPGSANITTANGDTALAVYQGSGNWIVWNYTVAATSATPGISSEATAEAGIDNTTSMSPLRATQAILTNALAFANVAGRNGGFEVWQRGTSIAVAASTTAYTVDGWYLSTGANQACTVSRQAGLTNGSSFSARVQRNAGQTGTGQILFGFSFDTDELKKLAGKSVVFQLAISTGANWSPASGNFVFNLTTGTGAPAKVVAFTGAVVQAGINQNIAAGSGAATYYSAVTAIPAGATQVELTCQWFPTGTAGANDWFTVDDVDIRVVPAGLAAAKPSFERSDYAFDLLRCQRHLPLYAIAGTNIILAFGQAFSTTQNFVTIILPVVPRAALLLSVSAASDWSQMTAAGGTNVCNAVTLGATLGNIIQINSAAAAAALVVGNASALIGANANARFALSAEI